VVAPRSSATRRNDVNSPDYNPYAAPTETPAYDFARPVDASDYILATLGQRFAGNMIDSLVLVVAIVCAAVPIGVLDGRSSGDSDTAMIVFGVVAGLVLLTLIAVQWFMISSRGLVPLLGNVYSLVDTLCIFKEDRRTLRDMVAGTRVIQV
jgi:hypothetical protein